MRINEGGKKGQGRSRNRTEGNIGSRGNIGRGKEKRESGKRKVGKKRCGGGEGKDESKG